MDWLLISIALSVVLTVVLNVALRAFPDAGHRIARGVSERTERSAQDDRRNARQDGRRVRVWVPWKAMIVGSLILTIFVNLVYWLARV